MTEHTLDPLADTLADLLQQQGLSLSPEQQTRLMRYLRLLEKWNKAYNLTAVRDPKAMLHKHLLDSLVIGAWLKGDNILDVGTGPGLPGIPLAIAFPQKQFTLLDSNGKKVRFLRQACSDLKLTNVTIVYERVESFETDKLFDTVVSRAFARINVMLERTQHLCQKNGCFLAMKGQSPTDELEEIAADVKVVAVESLAIVGIEAERHLAVLEKV